MADTMGDIGSMGGPQSCDSERTEGVMVKPKILVVDDDAALTRVLRAGIEQTGRFEVCIENNPLKAVTTAMTFRPDLVVLDVIMPGLDGGDVASLFRAFPALRGLPVIFLTAVVSKERVADPHGTFIGGVRYVAKPIDTKDLIECIDRELPPAA